MDQNRRDYAELHLPPPRRINAGRVRKWARALAMPALVLCIPAAFLIGFVVGTWRAEYRQFHERFLRERDAFAPVLASDPAYSRVWVYEYTAGGICVSGEVDSPRDAARLRSGFVRLFGEAEIWRFEVDVTSDR